MFTGIIEEMGRVRTIAPSGSRSLRLTVDAAAVLSDLQLGHSVAVNGVCLTVVERDGRGFTAEVMPETWEKTALGDLKPGDAVNLERTMQPSGRFGGHIVQGHVDGVGRVVSIATDEIASLFTFTAPPEVMHYLVPKGSVAIDGISLTVIDTAGDQFTVGIIPHTAAVTTMGQRRPGDRVNLEADVVGKYVEKFVTARLGGAG